MTSLLAVPYFNRRELLDTSDIKFISPPRPKIRKPNYFEIAWKKVAEFVKSIWKRLCFWENHSPIKLSARQLLIIQEAKRNRGLLGQKVRVLSSDLRDAPSPLLADASKIPYRLQYPQGNPTLERLCKFLESTSCTVLDVVWERNIKAKIPNLKKSILESIDQVKSGTEIIFNLRQAASSILHKFGTFDDPILTIIGQQLLQILFQGSDAHQDPKATIEKALIEKIGNLKHEQQLSDDQYAKILSYIPRVINWLFNSQNWIINSPHPLQLHHVLVDALNFFDTFSALLKTGQFDEKFKLIKTLVEGPFEQDIKRTLEINVLPVTNFLANRFAELLDQVPFQQTYNKILVDFLKHIEGWTASNDTRETHAKLIAASRSSSQAYASTAVQVQKQRAAIDYLSMVKDDGGDEKLLEKEFHRAFSRHPACHPLVKETLLDDDPVLSKKKEEDIELNIIERLIPCLLPPVSIALSEDASIEASGISRILDMIVFPENIQKIFDLLQEIVDATLTAGSYKDRDSFRKYLNILKKVIMAELLQKQVKDSVVAILKAIFAKATQKEYLDKMYSKHVFPSMLKGMFKGWILQTIEKNSALVAPLFQGLIGRKREETTNVRQELLNLLYRLTPRQASDFKMEEAGFKKEEFEKIADKVISEILSNLLDKLKGASSDKAITVAEVQAALVKYLKPDVLPSSNKIYGELVQALLFKIGNFGGWFTQTTVSFFQDKISHKASVIMHKATSSYHLGVNTLIAASCKTWSNPGKITKLLFPPSKAPAKVVEKKAKAQRSITSCIHHISALMHDIIYQTVAAESSIFASITTWGAPSTDSLESLINKIYHRVFSSPVLNKSLYLRILDNVDVALKEASGSLQKLQLRPK